MHEAPPVRQLRTRPIDLAKRLPIVRSIEDLNKILEDDHSLRIDPFVLGFRPDHSFSIDDLREKHTQKKKIITIPPVKVQQTTTISLRPFLQPDHYIRYEIKKDHMTGISLDDGSIIHYDMMKPDEEFLYKLQKQRGSNHISKFGLSESNFCKLIDSFEKASGVWGEGPGEVNFDEAIKLKKDLKIDLPAHIVKELHNYWKQRRLSLGRPLIRMFWPPTNPHDTSPFAVFRPRIKDKMNLRRPKRNKFEIIKKLESSLDEFKKVEKIIKKMKQRDEKKLSLLELNELLFEQMRHEINDPLYKVPQWEFLKEKKFNKASKKTKKEQDKLITEQLNKIGIYYTPSTTSKPGKIPGPRHQSSNVTHKEPLSSQVPSSSLNNNFHLRIITRRGRGGRVWIDRKQFSSHPYYIYPSHQSYYDQKEDTSLNYLYPHQTDLFSTNPAMPPKIESNITSFDLYHSNQMYLEKLHHERILESTITFDEATQHPDLKQSSTFPPPISDKEEESPIQTDTIASAIRPPRDDWEFLQDFRAWLRYSLAPPASTNSDTRPTPSRSFIIPVKPE